MVKTVVFYKSCRQQ